MRFIIMYLIVSATAIYGQNTDSPFFEAREIMRDLDTIVTPNGIQENKYLTINGVKHWTQIRGKDKDNPILLFVHGGPASPIAPTAWTFQRHLEEFFTVVHYDQRGAGKTYVKNDTIGLSKTIRIDQYVDDAIAIVEYISQKLGQKKVVLVGHSWGTIVSTHAALKRPDLFHAYVGIGQVVNTMINEEVSLDYGLKMAEKEKNTNAIKEMMTISPYPGDEPLTRERIIIARKWPQYYGGLIAYRSNFNYLFTTRKLSADYTDKELSAFNDGSIFTLGKLLPEFLQVDFLTVEEFPVPIFMFMGKHDYTSPSVPTQKWLDAMEAPYKKGVWFENSAHYIPLEEPGKMFLVLVNEIRPFALK